jgi:hypothetical protein
MEMRTVFLGSLGLGRGTNLAAPLPCIEGRAGEIEVALGPVGRCPRHGEVRHLGISDISGSLGGNGCAGNDPAGLRHAAFLCAADKIARVCRCGRESIQVFSFDLTSPLDVGPVRLNRAGFRDLQRALGERNVGWGISTLGPSLQAARDSIQGFNGKVTLTVMSDFLLTDLTTAIEDLAAFPADAIHAIALTAPAPPVLEAHPQIAITTAGWSDKPAIVAEAIYEQLIRFRTFDQRRKTTRSPR